MYSYRFCVVEKVEYLIEVMDGRDLSFDTVGALLAEAEEKVRNCEVVPVERRVVSANFIGRVPVDAADA